jgi:hypothetical protein
MIEIKIKDKTYPCDITMGAMLRYKQQTGREANEMGKDSISDLITYLWCCTASACNRDKKEFGLSLNDFADALTVNDVNSYLEQLDKASTDTVEPKKKTSRKV